jgi:predicted nuclease of restriction endonuclease-like RecB superfamily
MLTSDLLVTRTYKGKIEPVFASLDAESIEIARSVIDLFQRNIGKTYGNLLAGIEGLEEMNYRFIRGLAALLERKCVIDIDAAIDPIAARRAVFEECKEIVTGAEERQEVINRAADKLSIASEQLEKALWADQEENLVLREFQAPSPEDLLRQYNLSLAQTLLFKATGMELQIESNYQYVFRKLKRLGLMYSIEQGKIYLDGPISLFRLTERYGTSFAKLLPAIIRSEKWSLKASIVRKTLQGKRILEFTLDHTRHVFNSDISEETFDSAIEKEFSALDFNGWSVKREPAVLEAGQYAFIPDFSLERNGTRIYVEIVGFWTPEYLKNKIQKINQVKENIILLVDKNLACSGSEFKTADVLFYDKKIPYIEIIKILRKYEEKQLSEELTKLGNVNISIDGDVIDLDEMAKKYKLSVEVLKKVINLDKGEYSLIGDQLVSRQTLETIQRELTGVRRHNEAIKIFEKYGVRGHCSMLEVLGYKVKWSGLDPENAEIMA